MFSRVLSLFALATVVLANPVKTTTATATVTATATATATATVTATATQTLTVSVTSVPTSTPIPASQCNTGPIQCCNSVESVCTTLPLFGLLGIVLSDIDVLVGITCTPITVIGVSGNSCTAQPVCCENDTFNGVVAIGCTPVNL
ncbi:fungal hydrophobin [Pluteus cervinus]|uniref:Fungal hydrophobin n=1 Tax=Pluteus cervinus TaxID=181527 RepID=A0ACD2ZZA2_9AGAR|nr:fungal hydrophobin [Pluteus cervinus]